MMMDSRGGGAKNAGGHVVLGDDLIGDVNELNKSFAEERFEIQFGLSPGETCPECYLFNLRETLVFIKTELGRSNTYRKCSGVDLYFVDRQSRTIRVTKLFRPYLLIAITDSFCGVKHPDSIQTIFMQVQTMLEVMFGSTLREPMRSSLVEKIDTKETGHLIKGEIEAYAKKALLKIEFWNNDDLRQVVFGLVYRHLPKVREMAKNFQKQLIRVGVDSNQINDNIDNMKTTFDVFQCSEFSGFDKHAKSILTSIESTIKQNPLLMILDVFESDIPYISRVCIETQIRCGKWYKLIRPPNSKSHQTKIIELSDQTAPPSLRVLAWDIETSKERLKFPDPARDGIMCISYMCDERGFLIINKEFFSSDIEDFEYLGKPGFIAKFKVCSFNDEKSMLQYFMSHIMTELKPHILVTYNGDFFDFPYVYLRAQKHGISMFEEMGFPLMTNRVVGRDRESVGTGGGTISELSSAEIRSTNEKTVIWRRAKNKGARKLGRIESEDFVGRMILHMDCLKWVERDSYLPCGSRGLKAATKTKLKYEPEELDPELMTSYAYSHPQTLAEYSVSDAVATYFLYREYVHTFTLALATIIPLCPDEVLRKGSGTLCENLLMAQAYRTDVLIPNKYMSPEMKWTQDGLHLLHSETYTGGQVRQLKSGIFKDSIRELFSFSSEGYQHLIDDIDNVLETWINRGDFREEDEYHYVPRNWSEVKSKIVSKLEFFRDAGSLRIEPLIYHLDVGAMYPNIILSQRLQPHAVVNESICQKCQFSNERKECQRHLSWNWKAEKYPLSRAQILQIYEQLSVELFEIEDDATFFLREDDSSDEGLRKPKKPKNIQVRKEDIENLNKTKSQRATWAELSHERRHHELIQRIKTISLKQSRKFKENCEQEKKTLICQREHPFYVETVRAFRDRRQIFKEQKKAAEKKLADLSGTTDLQLAKYQVTLYDSLQLAHKCILNSFYGYVMRKGARWYSLEMAAVVTHTGSQIIKQAEKICSKIGIPLELDTDGIWTLLPKGFPEKFDVIFDLISKIEPFEIKKTITKSLSYPCWLLNTAIERVWSNPQYFTFVENEYRKSNENSIAFEIDGPYRAMFLPASEKEDQELKKRYAVYDFEGNIVELKGFEIKRRGELQIIKKFQEEVFPSFVADDVASDRQSCIQRVAEIGSKWVDFIVTKGEMCKSWREIISLVAESKTLQKPVKDMGDMKSFGITTARRLQQLLGDPTYVQESGIKCEYVVSRLPLDTDRTTRAIPVEVFEADEVKQSEFLAIWTCAKKSGTIARNIFQKTKMSSPIDGDCSDQATKKLVQDLLDWDYYAERLRNAIWKIIVVPAMSQGLANPLLSKGVQAPDWILKRQERNKARKLAIEKLRTQPSEQKIAVSPPVREEIDRSKRCEVIEMSKRIEILMSCQIDDMKYDITSGLHKWFNDIFRKDVKTAMTSKNIIQIKEPKQSLVISESALLKRPDYTNTSSWTVVGFESPNEVLPNKLKGLYWMYFTLKDSPVFYRCLIEPRRVIMVEMMKAAEISLTEMLKMKMSVCSIIERERLDLNLPKGRVLRSDTSLIELNVPSCFYDDVCDGLKTIQEVINCHETSIDTFFALHLNIGRSILIESKSHSIDSNFICPLIPRPRISTGASFGDITDSASLSKSLYNFFKVLIIECDIGMPLVLIGAIEVAPWGWQQEPLSGRSIFCVCGIPEHKEYLLDDWQPLSLLSKWIKKLRPEFDRKWQTMNFGQKNRSGLHLCSKIDTGFAKISDQIHEWRRRISPCLPTFIWIDTNVEEKRLRKHLEPNQNHSNGDRGRIGDGSHIGDGGSSLFSICAPFFVNYDFILNHEAFTVSNFHNEFVKLTASVLVESIQTYLRAEMLSRASDIPLFTILSYVCVKGSKAFAEFLWDVQIARQAKLHKCILWNGSWSDSLEMRVMGRDLDLLLSTEGVIDDEADAHHLDHIVNPGFYRHSCVKIAFEYNAMAICLEFLLDVAAKYGFHEFTKLDRQVHQARSSQDGGVELNKLDSIKSGFSMKRSDQEIENQPQRRSMSIKSRKSSLTTIENNAEGPIGQTTLQLLLIHRAVKRMRAGLTVGKQAFSECRKIIEEIEPQIMNSVIIWLTSSSSLLFDRHVLQTILDDWSVKYLTCFVSVIRTVSEKQLFRKNVDVPLLSPTDAIVCVGDIQDDTTDSAISFINSLIAQIEQTPSNHFIKAWLKRMPGILEHYSSVFVLDEQNYIFLASKVTERARRLAKVPYVSNLSNTQVIGCMPVLSTFPKPFSRLLSLMLLDWISVRNVATPTTITLGDRMKAYTIPAFLHILGNPANTLRICDEHGLAYGSASNVSVWHPCGARWQNSMKIEHLEQQCSSFGDEWSAAKLLVGSFLFKVLTLDPIFKKELSSDDRDSIFEQFCKVLDVSPFSSSLTFRSPLTKFIIKNFLCSNCDSTFHLDVSAQDIDNQEDPNTVIVPKWKCARCESQIQSADVLERVRHLFNLYTAAFQSPEVTCKLCGSLRDSITSGYCVCGGSYGLHSDKNESAWSKISTVSKSFISDIEKLARSI